MSDFDDLEEISDQTSYRVNVGSKRNCNGHPQKKLLAKHVDYRSKKNRIIARSKNRAKKQIKMPSLGD